MNKLSAFTGAVLGGLGFLASPVSAVVYTFSGMGGETFTLDYAGYVTSRHVFTAAELSASSSNLISAEFCFSGDRCGGQFTASTDTIYTKSDAGPPVTLPDGTIVSPLYVGLEYDFASHAFATPGVHTSSYVGYSHDGHLAVGGTVPGAVPEPASWAMMLAGFGLTGAAMRRRKLAVRFA